LIFPGIAKTKVDDYKKDGVRKASRGYLFFWLIDKKIIKPKIVNLLKVIKEVKKIKIRKRDTPWDDYHNRIQKKAERFSRIIEIINSFKEPVSCAVDIAGNQGRFARLLIEKTPLIKVVCIDNDQNRKTFREFHLHILILWPPWQNSHGPFLPKDLKLI
jgi:hypothetical protein